MSLCHRLVACLVIGLSALSATSASAQTLRIALREDADILDPTLARTYVGRIVFAGLCDKLFDIDEKLTFVPRLATGYEWVDPKTLVIHLRDGVVFQDGERMDAAAVKYSLERHLTMQGSFRRSEISAMDRVEIVDPLTVRVVLKQPSSPFLAQLTDRAGMIVSPKAAEAAGKDFGLHPVCAGPFSFVERVPQDRIVLQRFPRYWDARNIHFDRVVYQPIVDSAARLSALRAGAIEMTEYVLPTDVETVRADPRLRIVTSNNLGYMGLTVNVANGPRAATPMGRDARVRKAFELSIDRAALNQVVFNGLFLPTAQAVPPESPFYIQSLQPAARDIDRAKALLREAGVRTPVVVNLTAANNSDTRQAAEVIQAMVAEAGFDVRITTMEFASSLSAAERGDFELYLLAWSGRPDPDGNLYPFLHSGNPNNEGKYSNPTVETLLDEARTVSDVAQRRAVYERMWQAVTADTPIIYLWTPRNIVGMTAKLSGFRPVPDGMIRLQGLQLAN